MSNLLEKSSISIADFTFDGGSSGVFEKLEIKNLRKIQPCKKKTY